FIKLFFIYKNIKF
ncbi:Glutathione-regulated potassium-efflux system protein KefC, partial [Haemophilus influenzae]